jgi:hypothetical protein
MPGVLHQVLAGFDGRCPWCDDPIVEGDAIVCADGDWIHRECAEDEGLAVV